MAIYSHFYIYYRVHVQCMMMNNADHQLTYNIANNFGKH